MELETVAKKRLLQMPQNASASGKGIKGLNMNHADRIKLILGKICLFIFAVEADFEFFSVSSCNF